LPDAGFDHLANDDGVIPFLDGFDDPAFHERRRRFQYGRASFADAIGLAADLLAIALD
jgi:hypothetical protein